MSQRSMRNKLVVLANQKNFTDAQLSEIHRLVKVTGIIPGNHGEWKTSVDYRSTYPSWAYGDKRKTVTTTYLKILIKKRSKSNKRTIFEVRGSLTSYLA